MGKYLPEIILWSGVFMILFGAVFLAPYVATVMQAIKNERDRDELKKLGQLAWIGTAFLVIGVMMFLRGLSLLP